MKIKVARTAGFCFGVRKALDLVLDAARDARPGSPESGEQKGDVRLCTLGPLIHNNQALEALEVRGVRAVKGLDDVRGGTVVIRAHGAGPSVRDEMRARHLQAIDATCPRVVRCQRAVERAASAGRQILIAGDTDHAEVAALVDFAEHRGSGPSAGTGGAAGRPELLSTVERAESVESRPPVTLVAQTTFSSRTYGEIAEVLRRRLGGGALRQAPLDSASLGWARDRRGRQDATVVSPSNGGAACEGDEGALEVVNSLCRSTEERQRETEELARGVDAVVVVGGRHSANTRRLAEVAGRAGKPVFHVETAGELRPAEFEGFSVVGVTAGASTPAWITESVAERLVEIGSPARRLLNRTASVLLGSNLLLAAGAASVTHAAMGMAGMAANARMLFLAFAYVFFAYATNRASEGERTSLAAAGHIRFFDAHKGWILASAWVLTASALALGFWTNTDVGLAFLGAVLFAALYSTRILPARFVPRGTARLRDIPGSKDFLVALALAYVSVLLPHLAAPSDAPAFQAEPGVMQPWAEHLAAAAGVFVLGFSAATGLELGDVHSDRLMRRESVAVLLGYRRARVLVAGGAAFVLLAMAISTAFAWMRPAACGLAAAAAGVVSATARERTPGDSVPRALTIRLSLLAAGPVAYLVTLWSGG